MTVAEWNQVMALVGEGPWRIANPLLQKIGEQAARLQNGPAGPLLTGIEATS
jgi:hypothetical protein